MSALARSTKPLTIAFFVEGMYGSGVDTSTRLLAEALRAQGHRVVTFLPWKERCISGNQDLVLLPSVRVNSKQAVYLSYPISLRLVTLFNQITFDVIHVHTSTSVNLLAWQMAKLFHLPVVYTYHTMSKEYMHYLGHIPWTMEPWVEAVVEKFDRVICNGADAIVTPSAKAARYLAEIKVTPPVEIIPNGIKLDDFYPWPSDFLQTVYGVPRDAKVLLWVGRLNQEKRPLLAYEIFRRLCAQRDDVVLVMVGDGALRAELQQRSAQDGLRGRFFLTGLIDYTKMPAVYNSADLWISTSHSEVHPMVAIEATACGLPAVAWADLALTGVIEPGQNGYLVDSEKEFLAALTQTLDNGEQYQQLRRATAHKREEYAVETTATRMAALYASLHKPQSRTRLALDSIRHHTFLKLS
jgi:1,2-diacylglycerol 3-alpha-glucosyltransferase